MRTMPRHVDANWGIVVVQLPLLLYPEAPWPNAWLHYSAPVVLTASIRPGRWIPTLRTIVMMVIHLAISPLHLCLAPVPKARAFVVPRTTFLCLPLPILLVPAQVASPAPAIPHLAPLVSWLRDPRGFAKHCWRNNADYAPREGQTRYRRIGIYHQGQHMLSSIDLTHGGNPRRRKRSRN